MTTAAPYRFFTELDAEELARRLAAAEQRFVALVGAVDPGLRPPRSDWTVRDIVGHMLTVARRYTRRDPRSSEGLSDSPREVDRQNAVELAALGDASRDELLPLLAAEMEQVHARYAPGALDLHTRFPFHGGISVDAAAGLANLVAEFLVHGRDLALAAGRPWPIEERDAVLILNGVMQILPAYARRSATGSLRLRLEVPGAVPWMLDFAAGALESRPAQAGEPADVVMRPPATTLLLALYARSSTLGAIRGGMRVAGGRRPWRILRLQGLLQKP